MKISKRKIILLMFTLFFLPCISFAKPAGTASDTTVVSLDDVVKQLRLNNPSFLPRISFVKPADIVSDTTVLSLNDLIKQMQMNNPQLKQGEHNYLAAKAAVPQALAFNNPQVGLIENPIPGNPLNFGNAQGSSLTITQSFSYPGKKKLAGDIAEYQAEMVKTQNDSLYLQLLAQLKNNFYQFLVLERQLEINKENIQRVNQIKQIAKVRYANNAAAYVDYLNAQVAESSAENDQFALQRQIETNKQTINTIIGCDTLTPFKIKGDLPLHELPKQSLFDLENLAIENNPQIKNASLQIMSANKGVDLAKKAYYPDFQVVLTSINNNSGRIIGARNYGVEFDIVLPLWFSNKEKAEVEQANDNLFASRFNDQSVRQQIMLSVDTAYNTLVQAINQSKFIKTRQLEEAKMAYRLALINYTNATVAFTELLSSQNNLRSTELALIQSEYNEVNAYINLYQVVGIEFE